MMPAPFGWVSEENPQAAAQSAAEAAAARVRRQGPSRPFGALSPSPLENTARAIGEIPGRMYDTARKFTEGAMNMPLGASVQDYPEVIDAGTETAMNLVGTPGGTGGLGSGIRFKTLRGAVESDPNFVYHATNAERAGGIAESGKLGRYKPGDFTEQAAWPDGAVERRNYFTPTAENSWQFAPEDGQSVLLRIRRDAHDFKRESTGDLYSTKDVPASKIEALSEGGWVPLSSADEFSFLKNVKPARENLDDVLASNFLHGRKVGSRSMPIDKITTSMSSAADDAARAKALGERMKAEGGYWERPIVDAEGNVVEGQHRISALRGLGYTGDVPVTVVRDAAAGLPIEKMREAIRAAEKTHPDQVHQIIGQVVDMIDDVGSAKKVLQEYEFPAAYQSRFAAALNAVAEREPMSRKEFFKNYSQHIDVRGRESGKAAENRAAIMEGGFKPGFGINTLPPYQGGPPRNIVDKQYGGPRKGDVVYLVPNDQMNYIGNTGYRINAGWKPKPHEAITVDADYPDMYEAYVKALRGSE